ncbi:MAG TPA: pilus assembly protein PilP [bacterium]|nr:pilus assembly protein PilP [bacterium]
MRFWLKIGTIVIMLAFLLSACGGGGKSAQDLADKEKQLSELKKKNVAGPAEKNTQIQMATAQKTLDEVGVAYQYDPINKPDPFRPYAPREGDGIGKTDNPLLKYEVRYFKLVGIIQSTETPLAIFEDPNGRSYTVKTGDLIGKNGGSIRAILNDAVIITETRIAWASEGTETVEMTIRLRPEDTE